LDVVVSTLSGGQTSINIDAHPKWKVVVHVDVLDRADVTPSWVVGTDSIDVSDGCGVTFRSQVLLELFDLGHNGVCVDGRHVSSVEILCSDRDTEDVVQTVGLSHVL